jgi:hypothetical protein
MIIYAVCIGCDYEGSNAHSPMFKLKSDAIMEANAIANKYNDEGYKYEFNSKHGIWRDGSDFIIIREYDLI